MAVPFERFLNIRYAMGAHFRSDGGRALFLTDITGVAQVWTVDSARSWPDQLTFFEDRVQWIEYAPSGGQFAFGKDIGGNEQTAIFIADDTHGEYQKISLSGAKHMWGCWRPDSAALAWSHNGANGTDFDVYIYDLKTAEETKVWSAGGWAYPIAFFDDNQRLLVGKAASNADSDLYIVDLSTMATAHLTPHEGKEVFWRATLSKDNRSVFVATDRFGDFQTLARIDIESGQITQLSDSKWDVTSIHALSESSLVIDRNVNGYAQLTVFDIASGTERALTTPDGVLGPVREGPTEANIAFTVSAPNDAVDVFTLDVEDDELTRWTRSSLGGVPRSILRGPQSITYTSFDGLELQGLYYRPEHTTGKIPVVIDIHGGPEAQRRPTFSATTQYYMQLGIAVFAPNVRGSAGFGKTFMSLDDVELRMDSVKDIEATYQWLVTEGGADPERIAVLGGSYGGFMVLSSMVTYPDLFACGVDIVGVANLVTFLENTSDYRRALREAEYGSLEHDREFLQQISPLNHIEKISAPLMVVHGRNDPRVPVSEAEQVVDALESRGVPVECLIYDDEGHGIAKRKNRIDAYPKIASFLCKHLQVEV